MKRKRTEPRFTNADIVYLTDYRGKKISLSNETWAKVTGKPEREDIRVPFMVKYFAVVIIDDKKIQTIYPTKKMKGGKIIWRRV